jgi:hypothetical protein
MRRRTGKTETLRCVVRKSSTMRCPFATKHVYEQLLVMLVNRIRTQTGRSAREIRELARLRWQPSSWHDGLDMSQQYKEFDKLDAKDFKDDLLEEVAQLMYREFDKPEAQGFMADYLDYLDRLGFSYLRDRGRPERAEGAGATSNQGRTGQGERGDPRTRRQRRQRGRPRDTDPIQDQRIFDAWSTGRYRTYQELADELHIDKLEVKWGIDRLRKRQERQQP